MLTDIVVEHVYQGRKQTDQSHFTLHPFANRQGAHQGCYEILHSRRGAGHDPAHSGYVNLEQLAELYASGWMQKLGLRLRLKPAAGVLYPDSLPAKKVPASAIKPESDFARLVAAVAPQRELTQPLRNVLQGMGLSV